MCSDPGLQWSTLGQTVELFLLSAKGSKKQGK